MAEGGHASRLLQEVAGELARFAGDGKEQWCLYDGRSQLPQIERLVREKYELEQGKRPPAELVCQAIKEACERLVDVRWREASLTHLGFDPDSTGPKGEREDDAAARLSMSGRTYRRTAGEKRHKGRKYGGRTYNTWSELTLALVAEALINPNSGLLEQGDGVQPIDNRPCLGDLARNEVSARYQPLKADDFSKSFFHRSSTDAYIDELASLDAVTLYTGGAISTELHAPLSDTLLAGALRERLRHRSAELNERQLKRVIDALMRAYPPAQLGSIAREFVRQQSEADPRDVDALETEAQRVFSSEFQDALIAGRDTGGFLALGIGALAFALRKAGRDPVRVLTTSYDDKITEAEARVQEYFADLRGYAFDPRPLEASEEAEAKSIPLYRLNGHVRGGSGSDALIIGEADWLTVNYGNRSQRIDQALAETACIFIGTELTEPDVLEKLANAHYPKELPRYAVVLPPNIDVESREERAEVLNLAAQRFLHLGVVPIVIDFPHQAPQFLIEVALRLQQGDKEYRSYATRLQKWWDSWAKEFGFASGKRGTEGRRDRVLQEEWMNELEKIRDLVAREHLEIPANDDEQIELEVWIRHPDQRSLILWSTSDGLWLNSHTADRCYIHKGPDVPVQRAFREGTPVFGRVDPPRGGWRYQLSIPLVLRKDPWHHLPVGVVNILSNQDPPGEDDKGNTVGTGSRLAAFPKRPKFAVDFAALSSTIKKPINALLDRGSPRWRKKGTATARKRAKAKAG